MNGPRLAPQNSYSNYYFQNDGASRSFFPFLFVSGSVKWLRARLLKFARFHCHFSSMTARSSHWPVTGFVWRQISRQWFWHFHSLKFVFSVLSVDSLFIDASLTILCMTLAKRLFLFENCNALLTVSSNLTCKFIIIKTTGTRLITFITDMTSPIKLGQTQK